MNFLQAIARKKIANPILKNNGTLTVNTVDTAGYQAARIYVDFGLIDVALTTLKIQESDDDAASDPYADVTGLSFTGASLPASGDNGKSWLFDLTSLRGRKRWLKVVAVIGNGSTGANVEVIALLGKAEITPDTNTLWAVDQVLSL